MGIHGGGGVSGSVFGGDGGGIVNFSGHYGCGSGKGPTDRISQSKEVPPAGVGFCAAHPPVNRDVVSACGGRTVRRVPTKPLEGGHIQDPW